MEQNIRLSKNAIRKARRQAAQEMRKVEKQQEESSSDSQGKIMIGKGITEESKTQISEEVQKMIEEMKKLISRQEETIFNQSMQIRELETNINVQNNEMEILRNQLIENKLVTEEQLWFQSQQSFKLNSKMDIEKTPTQIKKVDSKETQIIESNVIQRLEKIEKKFFLKQSEIMAIKKNANSANLVNIYYETADNEKNK